MNEENDIGIEDKEKCVFSVVGNWEQDRASPSGRSARKEKIPNNDFNLTKAFVTDSAINPGAESAPIRLCRLNQC
jgi:hypothetical protein